MTFKYLILCKYYQHRKTPKEIHDSDIKKNYDIRLGQLLSIISNWI